MSTQAITVVADEESGIGGMLSHAPSVSTAIQLAAAMVDRRISTARSFPRSIARFKTEAKDLLTQDIETARSAEYAKPVGNGSVRGPSIRLAELAAMCWGNLDVAVDEPIVGDKSVTVKATAWDLQRNYRQEAVVSTSILRKDGGRYPAHMVETAALATAAKAKRNAILAVIPRAYINDLLEVAKEVANKNAEPLEAVRGNMLESFARTYKVKPDRVCEMLGVQGVDDIGTEQIATLRAVWVSLTEGSAVEEFFPMKTASKAEDIKAKVAERKAAQAPAAPVNYGTTKPAGKSLLLDLLDQFEQAGGNVPEFFGKHNLLTEDLENARGPKSNEYGKLLRDALAELKGGGQ